MNIYIYIYLQEVTSQRDDLKQKLSELNEQLTQQQTDFKSLHSTHADVKNSNEYLSQKLKETEKELLNKKLLCDKASYVFLLKH
jgi:uncharacterized coiled-coil DUF342 family protein